MKTNARLALALLMVAGTVACGGSSPVAPETPALTPAAGREGAVQASTKRIWITEPGAPASSLTVDEEGVLVQTDFGFQVTNYGPAVVYVARAGMATGAIASGESRNYTETEVDLSTAARETATVLIVPNQ